MKLIYCLSASIALLTAACSPGHETSSQRPTVAVSIAPQQYLLERITGDSINIVTLLPPDADPESYEPTMKTLKELGNSSVYFAIGNMPFESQLLERSGATDNDAIKIVSAINLQNITDTHCGDPSHHHDSEATDPHIWTSINNCAAIARQMTEAIVEIDPDNEEYYRNRYTMLKHTLDSLNSAISSRLEPCAGDMIIVEHPSLSYFTRDYGLKQMYFGAENKEITPNRLRAVIDSAGIQQHAVTMVCEPGYNADRTRAIAAQAGAESVETNTLGIDFLQQLDELSQKLVQSHNAHSQSTK